VSAAPNGPAETSVAISTTFPRLWAIDHQM
jgi:hypothetical protein